MEISHQQSVLEELIMASKMDTSFPSEFFPNSWSYTPFDPTPDLLFPVTNNASLLEFNYPSCPFGEFQPFLDALISPEFGEVYDKVDYLPPMAVVPEDYASNVENGETASFLNSCINGFEDGIAGFKAESTTTEAQNTVGSNVNAGFCSERKSKSKKPDGQPSKNLMAERRRRKRLNDRLSMLRSIVPKISKMDRTSILGDTIDYMRELLDKIHKLGDDSTDQANPLRSHSKDPNPHETQVRNPPKFDVERRDQDTRVGVCCTAKPGLLLSTLTTLDALGLDVHQCVISCFNDFSLQASCYEVADQRSIVSCEDVKQALFRNAGYGGRCL